MFFDEHNMGSSGSDVKFLTDTLPGFNSVDIAETILGTKPQREKTIQKRIDRAKAFTNTTLLSLSRQASLLVFCGVIVLGAVMAGIAIHQEWPLPGPSALIVDGTTSTGDIVRYGDVATFVSDQALRRALSDAFEVFGLSLSRVTNNRENTVFSIFVFLYRLSCALAGAALVRCARPASYERAYSRTRKQTERSDGIVVHKSQHTGQILRRAIGTKVRFATTNRKTPPRIAWLRCNTSEAGFAAQPQTIARSSELSL